MRSDNWKLMLRSTLIGTITLISIIPVRATEPDDGRVQIRVRPTAEVLQPLVRIAAVADISGGNEQIRQAIARLDVAELPEIGTEDEISSFRILARVALAGFSPDECAIEGADAVRVTRAEPLAADVLIRDTIQRVVSERFNVTADDVRIRLRSPLSSRLAESLRRTDVLHLDVQLPQVVRLGTTSVTLRVLNEQGLHSSWPIPVDVELRQQVLVATRPLPSGSELTPSDVSLEQRYVADPVEQLNSEEVVGRSARRPLYPGEILSERNLAPRRPVRVEPLVRPRDNVRLVARSGAIEVTVSTAEVLQEGAEGDLVRVKNSASGKVVVGRVVTAELIEVPL